MNTHVEDRYAQRSRNCTLHVEASMSDSDPRNQDICRSVARESAYLWTAADSRGGATVDLTRGPKRAPNTLRCRAVHLASFYGCETGQISFYVVADLDKWRRGALLHVLVPCANSRVCVCTAGSVRLPPECVRTWQIFLSLSLVEGCIDIPHQSANKAIIFCENMLSDIRETAVGSLSFVVCCEGCGRPLSVC